MKPHFFRAGAEGTARRSRNQNRRGDRATRRRGEKISCSKNKKLKACYAEIAEETQRDNRGSDYFSASPQRSLRLCGEFLSSCETMDSIGL